MKKLIVFIISILLLLFPSAIALGEEEVKPNDIEGVEEFDNYINNFKTRYDLLNDIDFSKYIEDTFKNGTSELNIKEISSTLIKYTVKEIYASIKIMALLAVMVLLTSFLMSLQEAFSGNNLINISFYAIYGLIMILLMKNMLIGVEECKEIIKSLSDFMVVLIPLLLTMLIGIGGFTEAVAMDPIVIAVVNICVTIVVNFLLPAILMVTVLKLINNLSDDDKLTKLTALFNSVIKYTQGIMLTVFITVLTIRGVTTRTFDKVAVETAKFAVDNFVPVVGGALSDAVTSVANYSLLIKNSLSSVGLIVIVFLILTPIIKLFILSLINKFTAAILEPIGNKKIIDSINEVGNSLMQIISCVVVVSLMFFIMIAIIASAKPI
ncbi:stage III sporulation protein AE [Clostridium bornimense]|uniref:Stage III sporulation protein AE n=1 Tax=Clostridium bornimense TaxID=1216932 RepID=W6RYB0_9CLOT|nr:stage III sporulation protein AE [Clostridium bornimense]CDM68619.1 stage III sporulation protein AE [Clostridium bornimense]